MRIREKKSLQELIKISDHFYRIFKQLTEQPAIVNAFAPILPVGVKSLNGKGKAETLAERV